MEEQQQPAAVEARIYPAPPPFWENFTPENLERVSELRASQSQEAPKASESASGLPQRILNLPPELRCLQPPLPPADGRYRSFGAYYNLHDPLPSLEDQGIQQLYTPPTTPTGSGKPANHAFILKRLAKSLLLNFLELVGIMSINPELYEEKVDDLRILLINFHHLLNDYRPHQARETLIQMMKDQLEKSRAETEGIMKMKGKVEGILEGLGQARLLETEDNGASLSTASKEVVDDEQEIWDALEKDFS